MATQHHTSANSAAAQPAPYAFHAPTAPNAVGVDPRTGQQVVLGFPHGTPCWGAQQYIESLGPNRPRPGWHPGATNVQQQVLAQPGCGVPGYALPYYDPRSFNAPMPMQLD